jgi:hypothetical protein
MNRARRLQKIFSEIDPSSVEKWVDDFKRDTDPERELKVWEQIAAAYEAYSAAKNLPLAAKRDVYGVLLMRSQVPAEEVLKHMRLNVLTENDAREIMALYNDEPKPLTYVRP